MEVRSHERFHDGDELATLSIFPRFAFLRAKYKGSERQDSHQLTFCSATIGTPREARRADHDAQCTMLPGVGTPSNTHMIALRPRPFVDRLAVVAYIGALGSTV